MTESLSALTCRTCGAPVPLRVADEVPCPHCGDAVAIPERWRAAAQAREADELVRREVEPLWEKLTTAPPVWVERSLLASIVALPPAVTVAAQVAAFELHRSPPSSLSTFVLLTLPALLPGGIGWIRVWALRQTVLELKLEVAALPPGRSGDPPSCRQCAAPLDAAPDAISATCRYCGADSVVADLPPAAELKRRRRSSLKTLAEASGALRRRRRLLTLGLAGLSLVVLGTCLLLEIALKTTV
jgi:predicted RNA-binding Zn-ribbon protein involved in translation (DUF1610 family)